MALTRNQSVNAIFLERMARIDGVRKRRLDVFLGLIADEAWRGQISRSADMMARTQPTLLLFYHMEKSGGTTMKAWLRRMSQDGTRRGAVGSQRGLRRKLDAVIDYSLAICFMCSQFGISESDVLHAECGRYSNQYLRKLAWGCPSPAGLLNRTDPYASRAEMLRLQGTFRSVFPGAYLPRPTPSDALLSHSRLRIAVEFHAASKGFFIESVLPRMARLRKHYAALGGKVICFTLVRPPVAHLYSALHMWPPHEAPNASVLSTPLASYFQNATGAQSGMLSLSPPPGRSQLSATARSALVTKCSKIKTIGQDCFKLFPFQLRRTVNTVFTSSRLGMHNSAGCAVAAEALRALRRFDLVGTTSCARQTLEAALRSVGIPLDPGSLSEQRFGLSRPRPHGWLAHADAAKRQQLAVRPANSILAGSPIAELSHAWDIERANASGREIVLRSAACDVPLYVESARRSANQLGCPAASHGRLYASWLLTALGNATAGREVVNFEEISTS